MTNFPLTEVSINGSLPLHREKKFDRSLSLVYRNGEADQYCGAGIAGIKEV